MPSDFGVLKSKGSNARHKKTVRLSAAGDLNMRTATRFLFEGLATACICLTSLTLY